MPFLSYISSSKVIPSQCRLRFFFSINHLLRLHSPSHLAGIMQAASLIVPLQIILTDLLLALPMDFAVHGVLQDTSCGALDSLAFTAMVLILRHALNSLFLPKVRASFSTPVFFEIGKAMRGTCFLFCLPLCVFSYYYVKTRHHGFSLSFLGCCKCWFRRKYSNW